MSVHGVVSAEFPLRTSAFTGATCARRHLAACRAGLGSSEPRNEEVSSHGSRGVRNRHHYGGTVGRHGDHILAHVQRRGACKLEHVTVGGQRPHLRAAGLAILGVAHALDRLLLAFQQLLQLIVDDGRGDAAREAYRARAACERSTAENAGVVGLPVAVDAP